MRYLNSINRHLQDIICVGQTHIIKRCQNTGKSLSQLFQKYAAAPVAEGVIGCYMGGSLGDGTAGGAADGYGGAKGVVLIGGNGGGVVGSGAGIVVAAVQGDDVTLAAALPSNRPWCNLPSA